MAPLMHGHMHSRELTYIRMDPKTAIQISEMSSKHAFLTIRV